MAKDPAFLFYTQDFITGTMFMTNEQAGIYIRLLCAQHQHGGLIDSVAFETIAGGHEIIKRKFIETEYGFFNERLAIEMTKRANKSSNLSANAKSGWEKRCKSNAIALHRHMPTEDEDENINRTTKEYIKEPNNIDYNEFEKFVFLQWNILCGRQPNLSKVIEISEKRRKKLRERYKIKSFHAFDAILIAIEKQPFLLGQNERKWKVSFDWLIENDTNYLKIIELNYGSNNTGKKWDI